MGLFLFLSACTQDGGFSKIAREITVTPSLIDFGDLPVGATATEEILLTHVSGSDTTVVDAQLIEVSGSGFSVPETAIGTVVTSAEPSVIEVSWNATEEGWHEAQLTLFTNEEDEAEHLVTLRGHAGDSSLGLSPSRVDFGPVDVGLVGTETLTLSNYGAVAVTVDGASAGSSVFAAGLGLTTVEAGASVDFDVSFTPVNLDAVEATLAVTVSGGTAASALLRGNACDGGDAALYDADGDGWTSCGGDCDDGDADVHSGAAETCDGVDDDCDGLTDDGTECYDDDADGFTEVEGDCDDSEGDVSPGDPEVASNGIDDDCDGTVDGGTSDPDGDGFTVSGGDCDEGDASAHPGGIEVCDGTDQDCDGVTDNGTSCYDDDGDGLSEEGGDCDDSAATTYPTAREDGNGVDDDCDGTVDEGTDWGDDDGDGWSERGGDCDDSSNGINPGEYDWPDDGVDNDCDGVEA